MFWKIFIQTVVALSWWWWGFSCAKKKYKDDSLFQKRKDMYMVCVERIDGKVLRAKDVMEEWGVKVPSAMSDVHCLSIGLKRHKEEAFLLYEKAKENLNFEYKITIELLEND